ncbi:hypothetical protein DZA28_13745 [Pseudomonas alloputida]|uniref:Transmembrane protein n=1 Tax=Pseudomonas alloputida TaxID=1940621 RepID=A0ABY3D6Q4_9PSED|nr:hypothetical protein [Pseudomonas alloputida]TRZ60940.1 hypothetical protein DZA28_13745 [Pseudomonas alloputida]
MSVLKRLWQAIRSFLLGNGRRVEDEDEASFPRIDPDKIKSDLKVIETARAHGEKGVPDFRDTRLTETEHQIQGTVGKLRAATLKTGERWLTQIQARLDGIDLTKEFNHTIQLGDEFVRKADVILSSADGELQETIKIAKARKSILEQFRTDNRLPDAPPKMHGRGDHIFKFSVLIIFCALESVINANFFAQGLAGGLLGGLMMALMAAGLNLVVAFFSGRVLINKNHVSAARKIAGWFAGVFGFAWTACAGIVVAYLRFVLPQVDDDGANQLALVWQNLAAQISPFTDIEGVALCAITVIFGLVAMHHGYTWQDRYPGYAKVYGAYTEASGDVIELIEELRKKLEDEKQSTISLLELKAQKAEESIRHFKSSMGEKSVARKKVTEHLVLADNTIRALIQAYRYENQLARPADKPRPDYFNEPVELSDQDFPDFGLENDETRLRIQEQMLRQIRDIVEPTRSKIQSSFTAKFDQLKPLESLV